MCWTICLSDNLSIIYDILAGYRGRPSFYILLFHKCLPEVSLFCSFFLNRRRQRYRIK